MFKFLKKMFTPDTAYETRFQAALDRFSDSNNIYDVKLAKLMAQSRNGNVNWADVDTWLAVKGFEKEKMRDSVNRFMAEVK